MLHPYYSDGPGFDALQESWLSKPNLRIENAFDPDVVSAIYQGLTALPFKLAHQNSDQLSFQYWKTILNPPEKARPPFKELWSWLKGEGLEWLENLSRQSLAAPGPQTVSAALYTKGCYLEPHNDIGHHRTIAFVIGLTPGVWPIEDGGHLHFLSADGQAKGSRVPGYNTLDLFDVGDADSVHEIPILLQHVQRYTISGWFTAPNP